MILLTSSDALRITTSSTAALDVYLGYEGAFNGAPVSRAVKTKITSIADTNILVVEDQLNNVIVHTLSVRNISDEANVVSVSVVSASPYMIYKATLLGGESFIFGDHHVH